jgi:hypothetical protein
MEAKKNGSFYMDIRFGLNETVLDSKTNSYLPDDLFIEFGLSLYFNGFMYAYTFQPYTENFITQKIPLNDGSNIKKYNNGFWGNGNYWIDFMRNNFDFGYERVIGKKWSITPSVGLSIVQFTVYDSTGRKPVASMTGFREGFSLTRYFSSKDMSNGNGFICLSDCFGPC